MLLAFRVANFRSIRDEQELLLSVPSSVSKSDEMAQAKDVGWDSGISTVAAIYGANASGKSSVLDALIGMRSMVRSSYRPAREAEDGIPTETFALDQKKAREPSEFEVEVVIDGVRYQYGYRVTRERVSAEWLYAWPHRRRQTWFERDNSTGEEDYYFGKGFPGQNQAIVELTPQDGLFITTASERNHAYAGPLGAWFRRRLLTGRALDFRLPRSLRFSRGKLPSFDRLTDMLKLADLGISGIEVVERARFVPNSAVDPEALVQYELQFRHIGAGDEDVALPMRSESRGTLAWFSLAQQVLRALEVGGTLLVDELDTSLHPHLAAQVVRMFQDPSVNPRQAQLVFNTHDTILIGNLLEDPVLRRDQVWFTEKDQEGATHLYPLSDFKPRKMENLERGYLQGRYGAVPIVDDLEPFLSSEKTSE